MSDTSATTRRAAMMGAGAMAALMAAWSAKAEVPTDCNITDTLDPEDARGWLTDIIGSLASQLGVPADAHDPILALNQQWWALQDEVAPLDEAHTSLRAKMVSRNNGEPWDLNWSGLTNWHNDPDWPKLARLGAAIDRIVDRQAEIREQMVEIDATSTLGLQAKLRLVGATPLDPDRTWIPAPLPPITLGTINQMIRALAEMAI